MIVQFIPVSNFHVFRYFSWYFLGRKYHNPRRSLKNKRILYIGPTSVLGVELIKELSSREAEIIVATSEPRISEEIVKNSFFESNVEVELVDFTRLQSIGEFCNRMIRKSYPIDILINGNEVIDQPAELTEDRIDVTFQSNYLSHFLATVKLLPLLKRSRDSRVINITSRAHKSVERSPKKEFHQLYQDTPENRKRAFAYSKFCLTSFAWKLSEINRSPNLSIHCVDPGYCSESILQRPFAKSASESIQGILFAILHERKPGFYIENLSDSQNFNPLIANQLLANILWTISRKFCERSMMSTNI